MPPRRKMRKTLLAVGLAVLVSMMLAPHGNNGNGVEGWGRFFSNYGLYMQTQWVDVRTARAERSSLCGGTLYISIALDAPAAAGLADLPHSSPCVVLLRGPLSASWVSRA